MRPLSDYIPGVKRKLNRIVNGSPSLLRMRHWINGVMIASRYSNPKEPIKLHVGCGRRHLDGYVNVDLHPSPATDYVQDIRRLKFPQGSCSVIESYHVFEHMRKNETVKVLNHWKGLLREGGKIVIEVPDFDGCIERYQTDKANEELYLAYIFGTQRFEGDYHHCGYNFERLKALLEEVGFKNVSQKESQDYHKSEAPCLRVEGIVSSNGHHPS